MRFRTTVQLDTSLSAEYQSGFDDGVMSRLAETCTALPGGLRDRGVSGPNLKSDELPSVVVADLGIDGLLCVRRSHVPVSLRDGQRHIRRPNSSGVSDGDRVAAAPPPEDIGEACAYVLILAASDIERLQHRGRWSDFLTDVLVELDSRPAPGSTATPLWVWVRSSAAGGRKAPSQSSLVLQAAAATICSASAGGNVVLRGWEAVHSVSDVVERALQLADYFCSARDQKRRIDGPSHKGKQKKCEALDFFAVYRSMLAHIPGVSDRRAANIAGAIPTMDALVRLARAGALEEAMARVVGYGEGPDAGRALGARIAAALNRGYFSAHEHVELHEIRRKLRSAFKTVTTCDAGEDGLADDGDLSSSDCDRESAWEASTSTSCAPSTVSRAAVASALPTVCANNRLPLPQDSDDADWWMHT